MAPIYLVVLAILIHVTGIDADAANAFGPNESKSATLAASRFLLRKNNGLTKRELGQEPLFLLSKNSKQHFRLQL
ncbi:hypothetical protein GN958_ATG04648 [Phytophthora infestans]|uniref:Secreted RxLR effector peptide protein n=1 Tax=Phytophthora infestans TaxID=4787 RepID=A0A8S9V0R8_PHYIN|nr:hypothetical protein GN958_ATG04648 [Phytophthora infestans]